MARAVAEFKSLLADLADDLEGKVARLAPTLSRLELPDRLEFVTDAYPELVDPYLAAAGDLTATWYEDQAPGSRFVAAPIELPSREALAGSGRWDVLEDDPAAALAGSASRTLFQVSRSTVASNAEIEGVRWARHASANACGFCRMLATLGAVYTTESKALGLKHIDSQGHNTCRCIAVPVRGGAYTPPSYVEHWKADYKAARAAGAKTAGQIANEMDYAEGGRRYNPDKPRTPRAKPAPVDMPQRRKSTGPAAPKASTKADATKAQRLLPGLEKSLEDLRAKGLPEDSPQIQYHLAMIAKLRSQLAAA